MQRFCPGSEVEGLIMLCGPWVTSSVESLRLRVVVGYEPFGIHKRSNGSQAFVVNAVQVSAAKETNRKPLMRMWQASQLFKAKILSLMLLML